LRVFPACKQSAGSLDSTFIVAAASVNRRLATWCLP